MRARVRLVQVGRAPGDGAPGEPWPGVRRVLLVPRDRMSDLVLALPALAALRGGYPRAWLGVVSPSSLASLAAMSGAADEAVPVAPGAGGLASAMRRFRPDLLVALDPRPTPAWVGRREGIAHRVGPDGGWHGRLYERRVAPPPPAGPPHEVEVGLLIARVAGGAGGPARFGVSVPESAAEAIDGWLSSHLVRGSFVVIHPGRGGAQPGWPPTHYLRLAALLRAEGIPVVFTVGPEDELQDDLLEASEESLRRAPRFSGDLPYLAALMARAAVAVGSGAGPIHLAAAVGTTTLAFHAPGRFGPERRGPYAPNGWSLVAESEAASRFGARTGEALLGAISPAAALACVLTLLEGGTPSVE